MSISRRLFAELSQSGRSQKEMAEHLGVPQSTITTWKKKDIDPPASLLLPICDFLKIDAMSLLHDSHEIRENELTDEEIEAVQMLRALDHKRRTIALGKLYELFYDMYPTLSETVAKSS